MHYSIGQLIIDSPYEEPTTSRPDTIHQPPKAEAQKPGKPD